MKKYSSVSVYADGVIEAYKNIDSIGSLMNADPAIDEKKQKMEQYQKDLEQALDDFLKHLQKG